MSLLEADALCRRFGGLLAVADVSLAIEAEEIVGVIGPNGAGKSTLFGLLAGAIAPSAGRLRFGDRDVTGWRPHQAAAAGVARTFQLMRVFKSMTVLENVTVAAHLRHRSRRAAREAAMRALALVEMDGLAHMASVGLTAGWRKRLEIARAIASEPRLVLLDEVLSGLHPSEQEAAVEIVRTFPDMGIATVIVEHVMEVIMPLCDRVVVVHQGRKICEGAPADVVRDETVIDAYLGRSHAGG